MNKYEIGQGLVTYSEILILISVVVLVLLVVLLGYELSPEEAELLCAFGYFCP
jgi:hypothetical protein